VCRAAVAAHEKSRGGSIIVVSSTAGQRGEASYSTYAAFKGGQISFANPPVELALENSGLIASPLLGLIPDLTKGVFGEDGFKKKLTEAIPCSGCDR